MSTPIEQLIDASVHCSKCGKQGYMRCGCWVKCDCGWLRGKGEACRNPVHGDEPYDVACPHCGAVPGELCQNSEGIRMAQGWTHKRRLGASRRQTG